MNPLRFEGEPTPFPEVLVPAGKTEQAELLANAVFHVVRLVLPPCPHGLLWTGWYVGADQYLEANRPSRGTPATGITLAAGIDLDVERAYVRKARPMAAYDERRGFYDDEITITGVQLHIAQSWGLTFYNPTGSSIHYAGAAAVIRRVL